MPWLNGGRRGCRREGQGPIVTLGVVDPVEGGDGGSEDGGSTGVSISSLSVG